MFELLIVLPLATLLVAITSQIGGNGRLSRNGFIGLRIPSTMSSDQAWRAGHRAAARPAWIGFVVIAVAAIASMLLSGASAATLTGTIIVGAVFLVTLVWSVVAANRAARATELTGKPGTASASH